VIYKHNIERMCKDRRRMVDQIRKTVLHEIGTTSPERTPASRTGLRLRSCREDAFACAPAIAQ